MRYDGDSNTPAEREQAAEFSTEEENRRVRPGFSAGIRQKYGKTLARSVIQRHSQSIGLTSNERQKHVSEPRLDSFRRYSRKLRPF